MQVRTQLAVVALIAAGWSAGNASSVRAVMSNARPSTRTDITTLENTLARNPDDVSAARLLSGHYVDQGMVSLVVQTIERTTPAVQQDARVALHVARALERLGEVQSAAARANAALNRCRAVPVELADGRGCDTRTLTELNIEADALDRMIEWHITPVTDPRRAAMAHELSVRPVRLAPLSL